MEWTMKVDRPWKYNGRFPIYHLPIEIGQFSLSSKGKFCDDNHQLKYLVMPNKTEELHMDLDEGYSKFIYPYEDSEYNYNVILRWIMVHQDEIKKHFVNNVNSRVDIDFVCFRGIMKKICSTIYQKFNGWGAVAAKHKSVIYLAEVPVEEESESESEDESESNKGQSADDVEVKKEKMSESDVESEKEKMSDSDVETKKEKMSDSDAEAKKKKEKDRLRQMCTWGYKFEQYMTSGAMHSKPDITEPVNENEKFYAVLKGKFGRHNLLFGSELDCVDPAHFDDPGNDPASVLRYVELKTSRKIEFKKQSWNFHRHKLLEWYLQSYLVGTPRVICGFRDDEGIVREIKNFNVRDMPRMAKGMWSPAACLNFGSRFFDFVKETVVKDCSEAEYLYYFTPGSDIICEEIPASKTGFPPRWYTESDFTIG